MPQFAIVALAVVAVAGGGYLAYRFLRAILVASINGLPEAEQEKCLKRMTEDTLYMSPPETHYWL